MAAAPRYAGKPSGTLWTAGHLGIHHQTVANRVKGYAEKLPDALIPERVTTAELDELFTFIGEKKDLHCNGRRSGHPVHFRLESTPGSHPGSKPSHCR